jgi:hypothetical protein
MHCASRTFSTSSRRRVAIIGHYTSLRRVNICIAICLGSIVPIRDPPPDSRTERVNIVLLGRGIFERSLMAKSVYVADLLHNTFRMEPPEYFRAAFERPRFPERNRAYRIVAGRRAL